MSLMGDGGSVCLLGADVSVKVVGLRGDLANVLVRGAAREGAVGAVRVAAARALHVLPYRVDLVWGTVSLTPACVDALCGAAEHERIVTAVSRPGPARWVQAWAFTWWRAAAAAAEAERDLPPPLVDSSGDEEPTLGGVRFRGEDESSQPSDSELDQPFWATLLNVSSLGRGGQGHGGADGNRGGGRGTRGGGGSAGGAGMGGGVVGLVGGLAGWGGRG